MHVLIIGSGAREHALGWALTSSPRVTKLTSAPGNAGLAGLGPCLPIPAMDFEGIAKACVQERIDFVVVGPDDPLAGGLVDYLEARGIAAFGPTKAAARIESSKAFMKEVAVRANIPTAAYGRFTDAAGAKEKLRTFAPPYVVKADGLAAGKGVIIAPTLVEADAAVDALLGGSLGAAGKTLVIEEFLEGEELSFFALSDGRNVLPLIGAQDHKRAFDGDEGPNTGGMGAFSPVPSLTPALEGEITARIMQPAITALADMGSPFRGVLYAGLMLTRSGVKLIEFNARFGDPECQVLMLRLQSDLLPALEATRTGLDGVSLNWRPSAAVTVVLATRGYPGSYGKGSVIRGLEAAEKVPGVVAFHAGTTRDAGSLVANGGRVLNVAARGSTLAEARERAYAAIGRIDWPQGFCRTDIALKAVSAS